MASPGTALAVRGPVQGRRGGVSTRNNAVYFATLMPLLLAGCARSPAEVRPVRDTRLEWGLMQMRWAPVQRHEWESEVSRLASDPDYMTFYTHLPSRYPTYWIEGIADRGATTVISMELWNWNEKSMGSSLPRILAGEYDERFTEWAIAARDHGRRVLYRFGFEFNGEWFPWSGDPDAFIAAWRHVHAIFQKVGADHVEWVWSPNVESAPDTEENDPHRYYPGDDVVDWVAVDGYNWGDDFDEWHSWQSFEEVFGEILDEFEERYPQKPTMLAEFGCAPGADGARAAWIRDAHAALQRRPGVHAALWFNFDKALEGEHDWRLVDDDGSLVAFNDTFAAPDSGQGPRRYLDGRVLVSSDLPAIRISISEEFEYAGRVSFPIRDVAAGERIVFVDVDETRLLPGMRRFLPESRHVERLIIAQFEGFLPGVDDHYRYDFSNALEIGGHRFRQNTYAYSNAEAAAENPTGEAALTVEMLRARGYVIEDEWMMSRLVAVPDEARRHELILSYVEMVAPTGHGVEAFYGQRPDTGEWYETDVWKQISEGLSRRAMDAFEILTP